MSSSYTYGPAPMSRPRWISGVCADIAQRAAVPAWIPRVGFLIFGLLHWVLALILYFGLAHFLFPRLRRAARVTAAPQEFSGVRDRFRHLDERLSNLEAATLRSESELRRAFRDLERR